MIFSNTTLTRILPVTYMPLLRPNRTFLGLLPFCNLLSGIFLTTPGLLHFWRAAPIWSILSSSPTHVFLVLPDFECQSMGEVLIHIKCVCLAASWWYLCFKPTYLLLPVSIILNNCCICIFCLKGRTIRNLVPQNFIQQWV